MSRDEALARDMVDCFANRLADLIGDTLDTCRRGDIEPDMRVMIVVGTLADALVTVARSAKGDEAGLHRLIELYYRKERKGAAI